MHVAFWSPAWPLHKFQNGIITYVHWMKIELENRGHRVSVFTEKLDEADRADRVIRVTKSPLERVVTRIRRRSPEFTVFDYPTAISRIILREHYRHPIDVIEMEESFGWFEGVRKQTGLPVLVKLHGPAFLSLIGDELESRFAQEKIEREGRALRSSQMIISPSESVLRQTVARYDLRTECTDVIGNPVILPSDAPIWRFDSCDRSTILFVGRFDLRKGGDIVLQAFSRVLDTFPRARLIFVGPDVGWRDQEGQLVSFESYRDSVIPARFRDRVEYLGRMPNAEIAALRARSMVTVVASRWENQSYALLEAMLQGCPVVSSDAGGCPESVVNGTTGLLAKSTDPADFARQLCRILSDPESAVVMGAAARQYVSEKHSAAVIASASLSAYERMLTQCRLR